MCWESHGSGHGDLELRPGAQVLTGAAWIASAGSGMLLASLLVLYAPEFAQTAAYAETRCTVTNSSWGTGTVGCVCSPAENASAPPNCYSSLPCLLITVKYSPAVHGMDTGQADSEMTTLLRHDVTALSAQTQDQMQCTWYGCSNTFERNEMAAKSYEASYGRVGQRFTCHHKEGVVIQRAVTAGQFAHIVIWPAIVCITGTVFILATNTKYCKFLKRRKVDPEEENMTQKDGDPATAASTRGSEQDSTSTADSWMHEEDVEVTTEKIDALKPKTNS